GKDSALTLHRLRSQGFEIAGLLTTFTDAYRRVSMHGVREKLAEMQAEAAGLPLMKAYIPPNCSNEVYERVMHDVCTRLVKMDVEAVAFGDIFLEDVRRYREVNMSRAGMKCVFPLWGADTSELATEFIEKGFKAKVVVVDLQKLPESFVGAEFDKTFLKNLPSTCDPCGENGEFHTFVYDGPCFSRPVRFRLGEKVVKDGRFCFVDLLPEI
ncbi:MAG: diphthine--ammonia ligase, partial [Candidatus Caldarchaeum sp.]|nr:diphthine--ammonia ligase [Candidatus Caldarchaeum sp.]